MFGSLTMMSRMLGGAARGGDDSSSSSTAGDAERASGSVGSSASDSTAFAILGLGRRVGVRAASRVMKFLSEGSRGRAGNENLIRRGLNVMTLLYALAAN